jgi:hypothetical protein
MRSHRVRCFWFAQLHQKAGAYVEYQNEDRTVRPLGPDGLRSVRSALVVRTVRACAEQIRVPSFVLHLLAIFAELAREISL